MATGTKNQWKALYGRITLFPTAPASSSLSATDVYQRVWGSAPDTFHRQPNPLMPTTAQGKRGGMLATCLFYPTRIDLNLSPAIEPGSVTEPSLPLIEDVGQLRAELEHIINAISQGAISPSMSRVAVSLQLIALMKSFSDINQTLTRVMPEQYRVRLADEEDFIFQINRPRMSKSVRQLKMNFLTKWSTERFQILGMVLPGSGVPASSAASFLRPQVHDFKAASVTFDNNNVPAEVPLTNENQSALLHEGLGAVGTMQRELGLDLEGF